MQKQSLSDISSSSLPNDDKKGSQYTDPSPGEESENKVSQRLEWCAMYIVDQPAEDTVYQIAL